MIFFHLRSSKSPLENMLIISRISLKNNFLIQITEKWGKLHSRNNLDVSILLFLVQLEPPRSCSVGPRPTLTALGQTVPSLFSQTSDTVLFQPPSAGDLQNNPCGAVGWGGQEVLVIPGLTPGLMFRDHPQECFGDQIQSQGSKQGHVRLLP